MLPLKQLLSFLLTEIYADCRTPLRSIHREGIDFLADVVETNLQLVGAEHKVTSAFHSRTNSMVERYNGILCTILTKYVLGAVRRWEIFAAFCVTVPSCLAWDYS